jgi:hypothetical protein
LSKDTDDLLRGVPVVMSGDHRTHTAVQHTPRSPDLRPSADYCGLIEFNVDIDFVIVERCVVASSLLKRGSLEYQSPGL